MNQTVSLTKTPGATGLRRGGIQAGGSTILPVLLVVLLSAATTSQAVMFTVDASSSDSFVLFHEVSTTHTVAGKTVDVLDVTAGTPLNVQFAPGGFPGTVTVSAAGIVSYDPALEGTVFTGAGTNTLTIVTYPITLDSTDLSGSGGIVGLTNPFPAQTITYGLPAGSGFRPQGSPGGVMPHTFSVDTAGNLSYDPALEGIWFTGAGTSTLSFVGYPVTVDGQQLDGTAFILGFGVPATQATTYRLPPGSFSPRVQPGGRLDLVDIRTKFSVGADGLVDYDSGIDGLSLAGRGTSTLEVLPFAVTVDATGSSVDTNLSFTFNVAAGTTGAFALSVGTFNVNASTFGNIGSFTIDSDGSCSQTDFPFAGGQVSLICSGACADADGDGFGSPGTAGCPGGSADDCDDSDPGVSPGAVELPGNTVDEDCDGSLGACDPTADWRNHGQYVRCVAQEVEALVDSGVLTEEEGDDLINSAARSDVGKKN